MKKRQPGSIIKTWRPGTLNSVEFVWEGNCSETPLHVHEGFTFDLIESGVVEYRIGNHTMIVKAGQLVWIGAYQVHGAKKLGTEPVSIKSILLRPDLVAEFTSDKEVQRSYNLPSPLLTDANLYLETQALHETAEINAESPEIGLSLCEIVEAVFTQHKVSTLHSGYEHSAVKKIKDYLLSHLNDPVSMFELTTLTGLNASYLIRMFRRNVGLSPYRYLTELRIAHARNLLAEGMVPAEVAATVGLSDQGHLSRFFKRSTGVTPGTFRPNSKFKI